MSDHALNDLAAAMADAEPGTVGEWNAFAALAYESGVEAEPSAFVMARALIAAGRRRAQVSTGDVVSPADFHAVEPSQARAFLLDLAEAAEVLAERDAPSVIFGSVYSTWHVVARTCHFASFSYSRSEMYLDAKRAARHSRTFAGLGGPDAPVIAAYYRAAAMALFAAARWITTRAACFDAASLRGE